MQTKHTARKFLEIKFHSIHVNLLEDSGGQFLDGFLFSNQFKELQMLVFVGKVKKLKIEKNIRINNIVFIN